MHISYTVKSLIQKALAEDLGHGDVTTNSLISELIHSVGHIIAKEAGVIAGIDVAVEVFRQMDYALDTEVHIGDGLTVKPGDLVATVHGDIRGILTGERVALNFLQRLSGIASETSRYVDAVDGTNARIVDTRKTTPGMRDLEKYAIVIGGGYNHRHNLSDGVLIKDNHIAVLNRSGLDIKQVIDRARNNVPHTLTIEVEVDTVDQAIEALESGADAILLDNMSLDDMSRIVGYNGSGCLLEASGGINLETVRSVAQSGVDIISVGALTHSSRALDLSMDIN